MGTVRKRTKTEINKIETQRKLKIANIDAFYKRLSEIERELLDMADKARGPRRDDISRGRLDTRCVVDNMQLRWLADAARGVRRVRDER